MTNILLVDDEEFITELLEIAFVENGYKVTIASDGAEAFEIFQKMNFDVVVTDISMPKENGISLIKKILDSGATTSVIAISGCEMLPTGESTLEHARKIPIVHWTLKKPFSPSELCRIIDDVQNNR